jgi:RimJ/RimL family protein N-acetyltransferase
MVAMQPSLQTERLLLRPFRLDDAPEVQRLAGDREVASTTLLIPHPYKDGMAEAWIATHEEQFAEGLQAVFAIVRKADQRLLGAIGLSIKSEHARAELGYWIGRPYWNQGYATEAAAAVVRYGFEALGLNRVFAQHMVRNPASGRVMQKIGMQHEGRLRQHVQKWDQFEDVEIYSLLRGDG